MGLLSAQTLHCTAGHAQEGQFCQAALKISRANFANLDFSVHKVLLMTNILLIGIFLAIQITSAFYRFCRLLTVGSATTFLCGSTFSVCGYNVVIWSLFTAVWRYSFAGKFPRAQGNIFLTWLRQYGDWLMVRASPVDVESFSLCFCDLCVVISL